MSRAKRNMAGRRKRRGLTPLPAGKPEMMKMGSQDLVDLGTKAAKAELKRRGRGSDGVKLSRKKVAGMKKAQTKKAHKFPSRLSWGGFKKGEKPDSIWYKGPAILLFKVPATSFRPTATGREVFKKVGDSYSSQVKFSPNLQREDVEDVVEWSIEHSGDDHHVFFEGLELQGTRGGVPIYEIAMGS
jgi:hypothetical protein